MNVVIVSFIFLAVLLLVFTTQHLYAQTNWRDSEIGMGIDAKLTMYPQKLIAFNNTDTVKMHNATEQEIALEKSYATSDIFIKDQNYSNPTQQTTIPNARILNIDNAASIGNGSFRCSNCLVVYDKNNKSYPLSSQNLTVNPPRSSLLSHFESNDIENESSIGTFYSPNASNETIPVNNTMIPSPESSNYDIHVKKIQVPNDNILKDFVAEPTIAKHGNTIIYLSNYYGARSVDGGNSWNLFTDLTGDDKIEICCDQRILFDKSHDVFIWYAQGVVDKKTNENVNRLGISKDGFRWLMYYFEPKDIRPELAKTNFDYPYLVSGNNYLYLLTTVRTDPKGTGYLHGIVIRMSLNDLSKCDADHISYDNFRNCGVAYDYYYSLVKPNYTPVNEVADTLYWAFNPSNNQTRVYEWNENSSGNEIKYYDAGIPAWAPLYMDQAQCNPIQPNVEGNWCLRADYRMLSGWKSGNNIGFFWNANYNSTTQKNKIFQFPYINSATFQINPEGIRYLGRPYIYNLGTVFLYPTVAINSEGELGVLSYYGEEGLKPAIVFGTTKNDTTNKPWDMEIIKKSTDLPMIDPDPENPKSWGDFITLKSDGISWYGTAYVLEGGRTKEHIQPYYITIQKK